MRKIIITAFILLFVQQTGWGQPPHRFERSLKTNSRQKYLVHLPQNYNPKKEYPLFIAIHHKGGPAVDQYDQWNFFTNRDEYIMLCPQFFGGYQFFISDEDKKLIQMMREAEKEFKYDPERVYIVGFSMGAEFVQRFLSEHPGHVTAAAVLSARNYNEPPYSGKGREVQYFIGAGEQDNQGVDVNRRYYEKLVAKGYQAQFQLFPAIGFILNDDVKNTVMDFFKSTVQ